MTRRLLQTAMAMGGAGLLLAIPPGLRFEAMLALVAGCSLVLAIWIPISSRLYGMLALGLAGGVLYTVFSKGLKVTGVDVITETGLPTRVYESSGFQALQAGEWVGCGLFALGMSILLFQAVQALGGRLDRGRTGPPPQVFPAFSRRLLAAAGVACVAGLVTGWFRAQHGFYIVVQGLTVGLFLAYAVAAILEGDGEEHWTFGRRQILLLVITCASLLTEALVIEAAYQVSMKTSWFGGMASGNLSEHIIGFKNGHFSSAQFMLGSGMWLAYNMVDIVSQVVVTTLLFIRDGRHADRTAH